MSDLEALDPHEAMEMWLDHQRTNRSEATIQSYTYRVGIFVEWCESEGITDLNDLTGRDLHRFDAERRSEGLSVSTVNNQMGTLRLFLRFCETIDGVRDGLAETVDPPSVRKAERADSEKLEPERAQTIFDQLHRFEYGSFDHALFALAWHTGMRLGGLRALDVEDCYLEADDLDRLPQRVPVSDEVLGDVEPPFVWVPHHEGTTALKNQRDGERAVALLDDYADVLRAYINVNRPSITDENDRRPLFCTSKGDGRASKGTLRRHIYKITQPCRFGDCPHGRDPEECVAREHGRESRCPSVRKPHAIRTGAITHHLDRGWSKTDLGSRVNATADTIDTHYDWPDKLRRMQSRRSLLDTLDEDGDEQ
ncbi:integrase [Halarchaeum grantii]|uniref:Integrase n=1 Tax=Halarchaeum grantii TaxID=1193105 RepID=A0A830EZS9_9EURY|nr:site-specific integrase [Halarchaeum grantii]GGL25672.1 integrase [Halarchaeum grantii]